jgi:hypothetical protein
MKFASLLGFFSTFLALSLVNASADTATAIAATGYNADVIYGSNSDTVNGSVGGTGFTYYSAAATDDQVSPTAGLPIDGIISTATATFQLQPYTSDNVLQFSSSGTLMLSAPADYADISILANAFNRGTGQTFTFNYATGPAVAVTLPAQIPNWIGGNPTASGGTIAYTNDIITGIYGQPASLYEYDFATDSSRVLDSVTIAGNGGETMVYAISGDVPEPSTYALMLGGLVALGLCMRRQIARA